MNDTMEFMGIEVLIRFYRVSLSYKYNRLILSNGKDTYQLPSLMRINIVDPQFLSTDDEIDT